MDPLAISARTYQSTVIATTDTAKPIALRSGLTLIPAATPKTMRQHDSLLAANTKPAQQFNLTLCKIGARYGTNTRDLVALQLEYALTDAIRSECAALQQQR